MSSNVRLPLLILRDDADLGAGSGAARSSSTAGSAAGAEAGSVGGVIAEEMDLQTLLQVGDLARETGKTVRAIHLYEELQLLRPAARSKGRYRLYEAEALVRVRWIGKLQDMGFSLSDIQTIVRDWEESGSAPRAMVKMRDVYKKKLDETRENLRRLQALEGEIVRSLDYLDTCDVCEPSRLLSSCQACEHHDCREEVPELVRGFRQRHQTSLSPAVSSASSSPRESSASSSPRESSASSSPRESSASSSASSSPRASSASSSPRESSASSSASSSPRAARSIVDSVNSVSPVSSLSRNEHPLK